MAKGGGWTGAEGEQEDRKCLETPGELEMDVPEEASCGHRQRSTPGFVERSLPELTVQRQG